MTKVQQKNENSTFPLDKLAQLHPPLEVASLQSLRKRAKAKYFTNSYTVHLAQLKSPLQKSYNNTIFGCSNVLFQEGQKITSHYCNNRWCVVCNRIRTAKMINGYKSILDILPDKYFVTLTVPNVDSTSLRNTIHEMTKTFQRIKNQMYKDGIRILGLRKLECTYNPHRNDFHPHFHLIVSDRSIAEKIQSGWLKRYPDASIQAQDIRPCTNGSTLELFKYFTKIITKSAVYVDALDKIFIAMRNLRVYQPLGIKKVSEEVEEIQAQIIEDLKAAEKVWTWVDTDWIDYDTGELLTGYTPDKQLYTLVNEKIITKNENSS